MGFQKKIISKAFDKALVADDNKDYQIKEGALSIVQTLQQSKQKSFPEIKQQKDDVPTVDRLLGEVVSDFLAGLSKNGEAPALQEARDVMSKIAKYIEQSKLEGIEGSDEMKHILSILAEKVESPEALGKLTS